MQYINSLWYDVALKMNQFVKFVFILIIKVKSKHRLKYAICFWNLMFYILTLSFMNAKPPSRSFNFSELTNRMIHSFWCIKVCVREQLPRQLISPLSSDISFLQRMIMTLYCSIMKQRETYECCFWISTPKQLNLWSLRSISSWRTW